jgi:hypothetical protein
MFPAVAVQTRRIERNLALVWSRPEAGIDKGETKMNAFQFPTYPSSSSVASGVTVLVSAWFLVAAGAILSDPSSPYTSKVVSTAPVKTAHVEVRMRSVAMVPQALGTIHVSAKRTAT